MRKILAAATLIFSVQSAFAQAIDLSVDDLFDYVLALHGLDGLVFKNAKTVQLLVLEDLITEGLAKDIQ